MKAKRTFFLLLSIIAVLSVLASVLFVLTKGKHNQMTSNAQFVMKEVWHF